MAKVIESAKLDNQVNSTREVNMLRIKHKNISMQFVTLVVLCMCFGLVMSLLLTSTHAAQPPPQPYYAVDAYQTPGVVYRIESRRRKPDVFFRRRLGTIYSIALWEEQLYFCSANDRRIYLKKPNEPERIVFTHNTYIRDIAVDSSGNLYFTEASGAKGDGRIYKLSPGVNEPRPKGFSPRPLYTVELKTVDKFWAGDFTFDAQGKLYLSSGNHIPAFIYRVTRNPNGVYGRPQRVYTDSRGAIKGIAMPNIQSNTRQDFIYYADWKQTIYKLNIDNSRRSRAFSGSLARSRNQHLSDIAFDLKSP